MKLKTLTLAGVLLASWLGSTATNAEAHQRRKHHNHGTTVVVKPTPHKPGVVVVVKPAPGHQHHKHPRKYFVVSPKPVYYKPIRAGYPSLQYLGSTSLTNMQDVDTMDIGFNWSGPGCLMLRGLVLKVTGAAADIDLVQVNYGNNEFWTPERLGSRIEPKGYTDYIDLTGGVRCVDAVQIVGKTLGYRGNYRQATVQIYGY
ncbi:MAG: hypothetical protein AAB425_10290 [Bdellovibrionota bacterium]